MRLLGDLIYLPSLLKFPLLFLDMVLKVFKFNHLFDKVNLDIYHYK